MIVGKIASLLTNVKAGFRSLIPVVILLVYTVLGGIIFQLIEGPNEEYELRKLQTERDKLLEDTAFRLNSIKSMAPLQAYNHTTATLIRYRDLLGVNNVNLNDTKWNIWGAIYYSITIYTTIGYGNITCHTTTGRILTILYAFIGIPLALITLIALGGMLARLCMLLWQFLVRSTGCFSKKLEHKIKTIVPDDAASDAESEDDSDDLLRFPVMFLVVVTICWILFCAWLFLLWEDTWDYWTSLYFLIISFTTIGFGDVIPAKSNYIIVVGLLLLVGLSLVSTVLTIIQKQIEALASGVKDSIDKEYQEAMQQAAEEANVPLSELENADGNDVSTDSLEKGKNVKKGKEGKAPTLDTIIQRMPWKKRIMYKLMSSGEKKQLAKHAKKRSRVGHQWVQTDPFLMEDTPPTLENTNY